MDISGEQHLDVKHDIIKKRLDSHGNVIESRQDGIGAPKIEKPLQRHGGRLEHNETYCGSCYGAETSDEDCCNSCEEVREAYQKKGWAVTNPDLMDQVEFQITTFMFSFVSLLVSFSALHITFSAKERDFSKGLKMKKVRDATFMGSWKLIRWLEIFILHLGRVFSNLVFMYMICWHFRRIVLIVQWTQETPSGMYQYFIKVVPTVYTDVSGHTIQSNQFSVTEHFRGEDIGRLQSLPGVFFFYDLSPIKVTFTEEHVSFLHFLTNVCAIVGGVFTVSGILDSFIMVKRQ